MIVPKLVSSKVCLEQFYSSTGIQNELNEDDARLWLSEFYLLVGAPIQFVQKVTGHKYNSDFDMKNYTVPLPPDFYKLMPSGISVDGNPVRWRSNSFHYLMDGQCCDLDSLNNTTMDIFIDQFGYEFSPQSGLSTNLAPLYQDVTFDIYDDKITFNIKEGKVCLAYWALPFDNEGFIMFPDTAKYKRAGTDYLIWKNDYILWRQGTIADKVYQVSEANKNWSLSSAANELKLPDVEQLQQLKDTVVRLIPKVTSYYHFFKDLGTPENRRFR